MRWFIGLCSVVALLGVVGMTARPAAADKLPAVVTASAEPFIVGNPEADAAAKSKLKGRYADRMWELIQVLDDWGCVIVSENETPKVELHFTAQKHPAGTHYLLKMSLSIKGGAAGKEEMEWPLWLNEKNKGKDPVAMLTAMGKLLLEALMDKFRPCAIGTVIKTKSTMRSDDQYAVVNTETSMAPVELEMTLDENGAFVGEGPTAMQFTGTIAPGPALLALRALPSPPPPCIFETVRLSGQQPLTLSIAGTYRDDDASLLYDNITIAETGPTKFTSTGGCAEGMIPPEIQAGMGGGDLLGSGDYAQPLEDGAVLALPGADSLPPEVTWEGSVTLTYEPKVDGTPPAQPPE